MQGPFDAPTTGAARTAMLAHTKTFDTNVTASSGDVWRVAADPDFGDYTPLTLQPGERGSIDVTFTPTGPKGSVVRGVLYVDDFSNLLVNGNEQAAIPYRYRIG
jgi:hypothetical protein